MTARILANELANLIQESKRKNTELRTVSMHSPTVSFQPDADFFLFLLKKASEKSLEELKSLRDNEAQISIGSSIDLEHSLVFL